MIFRRHRPDEGDVAPLEEQTLEGEDQPSGPWDRSETSADEGDDTYLDIGGLVVRGGPDVEVQLQVDEASSALTAVVLATEDSGLELRAFAAPRNSGIWDDVRREIAAEAARYGGTATERNGEFGTELEVLVPVQTPDGQSATQPSRVVGVEGPRWLLRGSFFGVSAVSPDPNGTLEEAFRAVIVVRGDAAMMPREQLPLSMPPQLVVPAEPPVDR